MIEYTVPYRDPDEDGELICLITTILTARAGPSATLAEVYHHRWDTVMGCGRSRIPGKA